MIIQITKKGQRMLINKEACGWFIDEDDDDVTITY